MFAELSKERIDQILHEETVKKEETSAILRSIYTRYMRLYEKYFADIDALNDKEIAVLRSYHEETRSLVKYYYMDIPLDICRCITAFDNEYTEKLLGPEWHQYLSDVYHDFVKMHKSKNGDKEYLKAEFAKQTLADFYDAMDYIFRDGFGTGSETVNTAISEIAKLLFGKEK